MLLNHNLQSFLNFWLFACTSLSLSKPSDCSRCSLDHLQIVPCVLKYVQRKLNSTSCAIYSYTGPHLSSLLPTELKNEWWQHKGLKNMLTIHSCTPKTQGTESKSSWIQSEFVIKDSSLISSMLPDALKNLMALQLHARWLRKVNKLAEQDYVFALAPNKTTVAEFGREISVPAVPVCFTSSQPQAFYSERGIQNGLRVKFWTFFILCSIPHAFIKEEPFMQK